MKYLVVLGIVLAVYLLWRQGRRSARGDERAEHGPAASPAAQPQDMVRCATCAVHLPRQDALAGADGRLYCSQEHRLGAGG